MEFDDRYHLHVGYYEDNNDLEAIFLKQKHKDVWYLFFENEFYNWELSKEKFPESSEFGTLIGEYLVNEDDMTFEYGSWLFKDFLNKKFFEKRTEKINEISLFNELNGDISFFIRTILKDQESSVCF